MSLMAETLSMLLGSQLASHLNAQIKQIHASGLLKRDGDGAAHTAGRAANPQVATDSDAAHAQVQGGVCKDELQEGGGRRELKTGWDLARSASLAACSCIMKRRMTASLMA